VTEETTTPTSPDTRRSPQTIGKVGAYLFAFIATVIVASQTVSISFKQINGHQEFSIESRESPLLVPGLVLIGLALGVNISPETIANPKAIAALLGNPGSKS
jgi:hypothetical protein